MLNVLGGNKVYTVPEIDALLSKMSAFAIVEKLPSPITTASRATVYYKKGKSTVIDGYRKPTDKDDTEDVTDAPDDTHTVPIYRPVLIPYLVGEDERGNLVWYTTDSMTVSGTINDEDILAIWYYGVSYDKLTSNQKNADGSVKEVPVKYASLRTTRHIAVKEA